MKIINKNKFENKVYKYDCIIIVKSNINYKKYKTKASLYDYLYYNKKDNKYYFIISVVNTNNCLRLNHNRAFKMFLSHKSIKNDIIIYNTECMLYPKIYTYEKYKNVIKPNFNFKIVPFNNLAECKKYCQKMCFDMVKEINRYNFLQFLK